ncbi:protoporphyrinogen oxidase [Sulfitobacter sp. JBTF-M27]|uniref:Protoporphyrinogen oxidase n=1 Tax=Sulfitobacter sediminilitoris TaxID=2698830 RepID=A0A6P0C9U0_9RHOB|nr:flavodoxin domain-containing protein [Sulfitobacter sediminilitoris]NEK21876.1 protoporphyrinogen oxidase [Sulfitobacter sediminilitoris]
MKTLIIFGTVEGQTGKIARYAAEVLERLGHEVELIDADDPAEISFAGVDAAILAASVHQRRHPRKFEALLTAHAADLAKVKTLLLSVSLNAAFPEGHEEAREYVTDMEMRTHFTPTDDMLVGGALRTAHYDYFALQVIQHVVMRGRPFDPSETEHEFTDWDALTRKLESFFV